MQKYIKKIVVLGFVSLFLVGFTKIYNRGLKKGDVIDYIEVHKEDREMMVYSNGKLLKTYDIALGFRPEVKAFSGGWENPRRCVLYK